MILEAIYSGYQTSNGKTSGSNVVWCNVCDAHQLDNECAYMDITYEADFFL